MKYYVTSNEEYIYHYEGESGELQVFSKKHKKLVNQTVVAGHLMVIQGRRSVGVHRLIYNLFVEEVPSGYHVHHKDNNPMNNRLENLTMLTHGEHSRIHRTGKPRSEETKHKISEARKGKKHSEESKEKIRQSMLGREITSEWAKKIGKAHEKKVMNLKTGEVFSSQEEAAKKEGVASSTISMHCNKRFKKQKWKFI